MPRARRLLLVTIACLAPSLAARPATAQGRSVAVVFGIGYAGASGTWTDNTNLAGGVGLSGEWRVKPRVKVGAEVRGTTRSARLDLGGGYWASGRNIVQLSQTEYTLFGRLLARSAGGGWRPSAIGGVTRWSVSRCEVLVPRDSLIYTAPCGFLRTTSGAVLDFRGMDGKSGVAAFVGGGIARGRFATEVRLEQVLGRDVRTANGAVRFSPFHLGATIRYFLF